MTGALIDRAFAVLELLAASNEGAALSDVAARLDIPGSPRRLGSWFDTPW